MISTKTSKQRRSMPSGAVGLPRDSVAVCHQVTTLDRAKLSARAGALIIITVFRSLFSDNLRAYLDGRPLANVIEWARGY